MGNQSQNQGASNAGNPVGSGAKNSHAAGSGSTTGDPGNPRPPSPTGKPGGQRGQPSRQATDGASPDDPSESSNQDSQSHWDSPWNMTACLHRAGTLPGCPCRCGPCRGARRRAVISTLSNSNSYPLPWLPNPLTSIPCARGRQWGCTRRYPETTGIRWDFTSPC